MSSRKDTPLVAKPLTGGLDTLTPATMLAPSASPDLANVVLNNRAVERRGGFTPLVREQPKCNALVNVGHRAKARTTINAAVPTPANSEALIVPGKGIAGHRPAYNTNKGAFAIDFFCSPDHLIGSHIGNGGSSTGYSTYKQGAPYDLFVRPILSKGPLVQTENTTAGFTNGPTLNTTLASEWGGSVLAGMPFCFYLYYDGTEWVWALSFHAYNGATWSLETATVAVPVVEGGVYHVIGSFDEQNEVILRVARVIKGRANSYTQDTVDLTAGPKTLAVSDCPIQVFDCPQQFINATNVGSATQRPGLNLDATATDGGYFFASKRFEGRIEDIAYWRTHKLSGDATALDRDSKIKPGDAGSTLLSFWGMTKRGMLYCEEEAGTKNPIYLAPAGPVFYPGTGATAPGSWWFNGQTSYAQLQVSGNVNWNTNSLSPGIGAMAELVRQNKGHGIEVTFWPDSIEPRFEQVVMEIHEVMRVAIDTNGTVAVYIRDDNGGGGATPTNTPYQTKVNSTTALTPGRRYSVQAFRDEGGTQVRIWINGVHDSTHTGKLANVAGVDNIGGLTFGMGLNQGITWRTGWPGPDGINVDERTGFVGIIESGRIVCGEPNAVPVYKDEDSEDWQHRQARLWHNDDSTRSIIQPEDLNDTVYSTGDNDLDGLAVRFMDDRGSSGGQLLRYVVTAAAAQQYGIQSATPYGAAGGHEGQPAAGRGNTFDVDAAQAELFFVLCRWVLNIDDEDDNYTGHYLDYTNYFWTGSTVAANQDKHIHVQWSAVTDQVGAVATRLQKCCVQSDIIDNRFSRLGDGNYEHRLVPYGFRAPSELAVRWGKGLVTPALGQNRITLIHDWKHEASGERFTIVGSGRQLYWARNIWKVGSPFASEPSTKALWFYGGEGEHVRCNSSASSLQELSFVGPNYNTITIEAWVYPQRLDGTRLLFLKSALATGRERGVNFAVYVKDGVLHAIGTIGGKTGSWRFSNIGANAAECALRLRQWNHVHVTIGNTGLANQVDFHVDGQYLAETADLDALAGTPSTSSNFNQLFIGGMPVGDETIDFPHSGGTETLTFKSWCGLITEVRQRNTANADMPPNEDGVAPRARYSGDANTGYLFHFNDGDDEVWGFANDVPDATADDDGATADMNELWCIEEGLDDSSDGASYRAVTFRNRVYATNGLSNPQEIRFTRFSDPKGPFKVNRVGVQSPAAIGAAITSGPAKAGAGSALNATGTESWSVVMEFLTDDGRQSDPVILGTVTPGATDDYIYIEDCPRSPDPQVVGRRFYVGSADVLFHKDIIDNESREVELYAEPTGVLSPTQSFNTRLPAPKARRIAVSAFQLVLADLPGLDAGGSTVQWSQAAEPSYFPGDQIAVIDSSDGDPITGMFSHLGRLYLSKRSSIWQANLASLVTAGPRAVNKSVGVGGAATIYDNVVYGAGDRGVHRFDGANVAYASSELEGVWDTYDNSSGSLQEAYGAYYWRDSQYWLSIRRRGQEVSDRVFVLHTAVGDRQAWTLFETVEHSYMATVFDPVSEAPLVVLGTTHGQLLRYNDAKDIDGHDNGAQDSGSVTALSIQGSSPNLTVPSTTQIAWVPPVVSSPGWGVQEFDVIGGGLRGCPVRVLYLDGAGAVTGGVTTTITRNDRSNIYLADPISTGESQYRVIIGYYEAYWTSGWLAPFRQGSFVAVDYVDPEFDPQSVSAIDGNAVNLDLRTKVAIQAATTAREFDDTTTELHEIDQTLGWLEHPISIKRERKGRYFRLKFGTDGIFQPFRVSSYALRTSEAGQRGGRSN